MGSECTKCMIIDCDSSVRKAYECVRKHIFAGVIKNGVEKTQVIWSS